MLYGDDDDQRQQALQSERPVELPWIAATLDAVRASVRDLAGG